MDYCAAKPDPVASFAPHVAGHMNGEDSHIQVNSAETSLHRRQGKQAVAAAATFCTVVTLFLAETFTPCFGGSEHGFSELVILQCLLQCMSLQDMKDMVKHYIGLSVTDAKMLEMDRLGVDLQCAKDDQSFKVRLPFIR